MSAESGSVLPLCSAVTPLSLCTGTSGWGCHSGGSAGVPSLAGSEGCGNPQPRTAAPLPLPFTPGCFAGSTKGVMSSPCRWRQVLSIPSRLFYLQVLYEKEKGRPRVCYRAFLQEILVI